MQIFVGTSGWFYGWNPRRSLDWYVANSGLSAVELNASFYRFPFPNQIKGWAKKGVSLRWAIKVNRLVTHQFKFGERAIETWRRFRALFKPMDKLIDFYLFQLPPSLTPAARDKIAKFVRASRLKGRFALEPRHPDWWSEENYSWAKKLKLTWVSVDAPNLPRNVICTNGIVYERVHGRSAWYAHDYSARELRQIAAAIKAAKPKKVYVFFNNDHAMLKNAQQMLKILK